MLLINPHTSFYFRGEVHVVSEEGLNAYGAVTWGQFFVYQGFNEDTGWMHTSTGVDFMDEFVEDVVEKDGKLMYRYGDELRPVEVGEVTLRYRDGDGYAERSFPTYRTHHGPITHSADGKWVATKINWDPVNALRSPSCARKQDGPRGLPRDDGHPHQLLEQHGVRRLERQHRLLPRQLRTAPRYPLRLLKPVDGSDPGDGLAGPARGRRDHHAAEPGQRLDPELQLDALHGGGGVQPGPRTTPCTWRPEAENFRGVHACACSPACRDLTLDGLIELAYDPYLPGFEALIPGLVAAFDDAGADLPALRSRSRCCALGSARRADSVAMTLAHFYGRPLSPRGRGPGGPEPHGAHRLLRHANRPPLSGCGSSPTRAMLEADFGTLGPALGRGEPLPAPHRRYRAAA
jgi:acyl-homoserine-lactone acylase